MTRIYGQDFLAVAAVETVYGEHAAPTAASNAMRVSTDLNLLDGDQEAMEYDAGRGGSKGSVQRNKRISGSMTAYLAGIAAAGDAPAIEPLLRMCGLVPTIDAGVSVTYAPISTGQDSVTIDVYRGVVRHPVVGARANMELSLGTDALPKFTFNNLIGLYVPPNQVANFQSADFSAFENPFVTDPVSITKMQLFGQAVKMSTMNFRLGNTVVYRAVTNDESVQITERRPQIEITFEEPLLNTFNWWERLSTYGALEYQLGQDDVDESIFELDVPNAQIASISPTLVDGISHLQVTLDVVPTARDNDFTMVFRRGDDS